MKNNHYAECNELGNAGSVKRQKYKNMLFPPLD